MKKVIKVITLNWKKDKEKQLYIFFSGHVILGIFLEKYCNT